MNKGTSSFTPTLCDIMKIYLIYFLITFLFISCEVNEEVVVSRQEVTIVEVNTDEGDTLLPVKPDKADLPMPKDTVVQCDIARIVKYDSLIQIREVPRQQDVAIIFMAVNPACSNNVEYSEVLNEVLFKVLKNNTNAFVSQLHHQSQKKDILGYVISELEYPLLDHVDLDSIAGEIEKRDGRDTVTARLVAAALRKAAEKSQ